MLVAVLAAVALEHQRVASVRRVVRDDVEALIEAGFEELRLRSVFRIGEHNIGTNRLQHALGLSLRRQARGDRPLQQRANRRRAHVQRPEAQPSKGSGRGVDADAHAAAGERCEIFERPALTDDGVGIG